MIAVRSFGVIMRCDRCGRRSTSTNTSGVQSGRFVETVFPDRGWVEVQRQVNTHWCPDCASEVTA